jgi:hypothetical protein
MRWLEAVAIRAQNTKVLQTIVSGIAVDVVELDRDPAVGRTLRPAAPLADWFLQTGSEQS